MPRPDSVLILLEKLPIMGQSYLNTFTPAGRLSCKFPNSTDGIFCEGLVNVDTNVHPVLNPGCHLRLSVEDSRVVARVAGKVYPRALPSTHQDVEVAGYVARAIHNIDSPVAKQIKRISKRP